MRIDKFSFAIGAFCVVLIIGCVAQIGTQGSEGRYVYIPNSQTGTTVGFISTDPASRQSAIFSVLDTATGTMNVWIPGGNVGVYNFTNQ